MRRAGEGSSNPRMTVPWTVSNCSKHRPWEEAVSASLWASRPHPAVSPMQQPLVQKKQTKHKEHEAMVALHKALKEAETRITSSRPAWAAS